MRDTLIERIRRALLWDDPAAMDRAVAVVIGCVLFALVVLAIQERGGL